MTFDPNKHHRHSLRLPGYDYSQAGSYFVTICAQGRECLFGNVTPGGEMVPNDAGRMVERWWRGLGTKFPNIIPDVFVVMPNHFHGVVAIVGADLCVGPGPDARDDRGAHAHDDRGAHAGAPLPVAVVGADLCVGPGPDARDDRGAHAGAPLPEIAQWFKTMTTNEYIRGVKTKGWVPFPGRLWQRNYYEHIVRDDASLERIRRYIEENPARWALDEYNPAVFGTTEKAR